MNDALLSNEMEGMKAPVQCVDNPEGYGVLVYMDKTFYNCPLPQIPLQCMDSPKEHNVLIYYDETFYHGPQSEVSENDGVP